jgi:hypothetical protein
MNNVQVNLLTASGPAAVMVFVITRFPLIIIHNDPFSADSRSGSDFRVYYKKAHFTLGVRAYVQPKSSIPIGATVEISPKGFYTRSQSRG